MEEESAGNTSPLRHPTAAAILDATIAQMEAGGENSVRLAKVLEDSGTVLGSLYYHFGSRENLLKEAIIERFIRSANLGLQHFAEVAATVQSKADLINLLDAELDRIATPALQLQRARRLSALGSAIDRPDILAAIGQHQSDYFAQSALVFQRFQDKGLIDPDIDTRSFVAWYLSLVLSRYFVDLDTDPNTGTGWTKITRASVLHYLDPRDPSPSN